MDPEGRPQLKQELGSYNHDLPKDCHHLSWVPAFGLMLNPRASRSPKHLEQPGTTAPPRLQCQSIYLDPKELPIKNDNSPHSVGGITNISGHFEGPSIHPLPFPLRPSPAFAICMTRVRRLSRLRFAQSAPRPKPSAAEASAAAMGQADMERRQRHATREPREGGAKGTPT